MVVNKPTLLSRLRSALFIIAFVFSKLKYVPAALMSPLFHLISVLLYLSGHFLSLLTSLFEPDHNKQQDKWYGFMQFKEQFRLAALINIFGSFLSISAFYLRFLIVPASWVFLLGNIAKCVGEYHKLNSPPLADPLYSASRQNSVVLNTLSNCLMSLVGALSTSLSFFFPLAAPFVLVFSSLLGLGFGALSLEYWLDIHFGEHGTNTPVSSYQQILHTLGSIPNNEPEPESPGLHPDKQNKSLWNESPLPVFITVSEELTTTSCQL